MDKREIITKFIWSEIENLWQNCLKDRPENKIMGVPPDSFFIEERSSANRRGKCDGNTLNVYIRDDMGTRQLSSPFPEYDTGARRNAYWEIGHVTFHIAPGGENAVFVQLVRSEEHTV